MICALATLDSHTRPCRNRSTNKASILKGCPVLRGGYHQVHPDDTPAPAALLQPCWGEDGPARSHGLTTALSSTSQLTGPQTCEEPKPPRGNGDFTREGRRFLIARPTTCPYTTPERAAFLHRQRPPTCSGAGAADSNEKPSDLNCKAAVHQMPHL